MPQPTHTKGPPLFRIISSSHYSASYNAVLCVVSTSCRKTSVILLWSYNGVDACACTTRGLEQFCLPLISQLHQLQQDQPINDEAFCLCLREITGILRSCTKSQQYITVYDLMYVLSLYLILLAVLLYMM